MVVVPIWRKEEGVVKECKSWIADRSNGSCGQNGGEWVGVLRNWFSLF